MNFCKIRTSKLNYREIWRIYGFLGFPIIAFLKMLHLNLPGDELYCVPCLWSHMNISPESVSPDIQREISAIITMLSFNKSPWECHYFRKPHQSFQLVDSGGAFLFTPESLFSVMHICARTLAGTVASVTYISSFRQNDHVIVTTNNRNLYDPVPGSDIRIARGMPEDLIRVHKFRIAQASDLVYFNSFEQFTEAYDRREQIQADWDIARGVYVKTDKHTLL